MNCEHKGQKSIDVGKWLRYECTQCGLKLYWHEWMNLRQDQLREINGSDETNSIDKGQIYKS
jgi:hypothetical protein